MTILSLACIFISFFDSVAEYVVSLWVVISKLRDAQSVFGLLDVLSAVTNNC